MHIYSERNCYTYLIGWKNLNMWYYGVKYGKDANPANFWVTYFTSSKSVHKLIKTHGEPDIKQIRKIFGEDSEKAVKWESKVLRRIGIPHNKNFLNGHSAGGGYKASLQASKVNRNKVVVKDSLNNTFSIAITDHRYTSGELSGITKGRTAVINEFGNTIMVNVDDAKLKSGIYTSVTEGKIKDFVHYYNEETLEEICLHRSEMLPAGYKKGFAPGKRSGYSRKKGHKEYYNETTDHIIKIPLGREVPDGYTLGSRPNRNYGGSKGAKLFHDPVTKDQRMFYSHEHIPANMVPGKCK